MKLATAIAVFMLFWCWETWRPYFGQPERLRHAARNVALAVANTVVLALAFASLTASVADWAEEAGLGLLNEVGIESPLRFLLALVLLDGWMYVWHRANHVVPFLWRFHRMHHSDPHMDVTTATRFHLGELAGASLLRLGLIPVFGFSLLELLAYDTAVIAVTQFHHADISLGRWDRWLRLLIVTPDMHKVHHSNWKPETDSNYSAVLSVWDRLARSFHLRSEPKMLVFGLSEFGDRSWQTWWGMWRTPFT